MRKREPSGFHVGEQSLALVEQVFAVLYRVLVTIEWIVCQRNMEVAENTAKTLLSALREARLASQMFEDLAADHQINSRAAGHTRPSAIFHP